jgi:hypothetical protein
MIPSVASINGMAVKDYLQALQDDSLISAEKIGEEGEGGHASEGTRRV